MYAGEYAPDRFFTLSGSLASALAKAPGPVGHAESSQDPGHQALIALDCGGVAAQRQSYCKYFSRRIFTWCNSCPAARKARPRTVRVYLLAMPCRSQACWGRFWKSAIVD